MAIGSYLPDSLSPYYGTYIFDKKFLDILSYRNITKRDDDKLITLSTVYHLRPDLLAYDLYGSPKLWWVFAARNPNTLADPLWDFVAGINIYIPQKSVLQIDLGL